MMGASDVDRGPRLLSICTGIGGLDLGVGLALPGLEQSAWSRGKPRASKSWHRGWKTGDFIQRLFGRMPEPSMASRGVAEFMESLPVIRASHSASQASDKGPTTRDTSGPRSSASLAKWDPSSCSWRMSQDTFDWASTECSVILPKSGSTRSGRLYERPMSEPHTEGSESSSWPTPRAFMHKDASYDRGRSNLGEVVTNWATPTARDWKDGADPSDKTPTNALLGRQAPRVTGQMFRGGSGRLFPTPRAQDSYERSNRKTIIRARQGEAQMTLTRWVRGPQASRLRLNPNFVEWLMGFPEGWTVCEPSATLSSRSKQHSRSDSSSQGSNNE